MERHMDNLEKLINLAIEEDMPSGDVTTDNLIPQSSISTAKITAKEDLTICGLDVAKKVFLKIDNSLNVKLLAKDGDKIKKGCDVLEVSGSTAGILKAERIALNFMQRLSGISSITRKYVDIASKYGVQVWDTRKTTPGFRILEKMAVRCGGGTNHRISLSDAVMIKDNHIAAHGSIENAVKKARELAPKGTRIEVETRTLKEVEVATPSNPDIIMLDNMDPETILKAKEIIGPKIIIEVSGGINLDTIESYAKTKVSCISVGALTHSVKSSDLSLNITID
jgi:nicotinate-nucleotide pyrophosphorylase (carboxylating)